MFSNSKRPRFFQLFKSDQYYLHSVKSINRCTRDRKILVDARRCADTPLLVGLNPLNPLLVYSLEIKVGHDVDLVERL